MDNHGARLHPMQMLEDGARDMRTCAGAFSRPIILSVHPPIWAGPDWIHVLRCICVLHVASGFNALQFAFVICRPQLTCPADIIAIWQVQKHRILGAESVDNHGALHPMHMLEDRASKLQMRTIAVHLTNGRTDDLWIAVAKERCNGTRHQQLAAATIGRSSGASSHRGRSRQMTAIGSHWMKRKQMSRCHQITAIGSHGQKRQQMSRWAAAAATQRPGRKQAEIWSRGSVHVMTSSGNMSRCRGGKSFNRVRSNCNNCGNR